MNDSEIKLIVLDMFCGAGGTSTGILKDPRAKVIICINHDENAIKSHAANHPECHHFTEDIRHVKLEELRKLVNEAKIKYPNALFAAHASLECTFFSNARGGGPKDADSRSLAEDMFRYRDYLQPDIFTIENVREFLDYGPLDENDNVIKDRKGEYYDLWIKNMCNHDEYSYDYKILNAADYGAYTTRKRYFGIFSKNKEHITFPTVTHFKDRNYKQVKDILNIQDKGKSIFNRKKPYVDPTLNRIINGLKAYKEPYLICYYGNGKNYHTIKKPSVTLTTKDRLSLVTPFILRDYTKGYLSSIKEPAGTLLTIPKINVVTPTFLLNPQWGNDTGKSVYKPCFTLIARMDKAAPLLVQSQRKDSIKANILYSDTDSDKMKELKDYMNENDISDIYMRPLKIPELLQIQGFPKDYALIGTQTQQKKYIGNSVETTVMHKWIESIINKIEQYDTQYN